jgi:hypothetical protein
MLQFHKNNGIQFVSLINFQILKHTLSWTEKINCEIIKVPFSYSA